jgi:hypothetical protein
MAAIAAASSSFVIAEGLTLTGFDYDKGYELRETLRQDRLKTH